MKYASQLLSATFLVAGTCIGAGMLALPVATAQMGFFPSIATMTCAWIAMTATSLCLVEVGFWMRKDDAHIISMNEQFLGRPGEIISGLLYLLVCYGSLVAYTAGGGDFLAKTFASLFHISLSQSTGCVLFVLLFGPVIFASHIVLGKINSFFFVAMIVSYFALIIFGVGQIQPALLMRSDWSAPWIAFPLLLAAFSIQTMVPSLHPFLNHHGPSLRIAIIGGTTIAFIIYIIWQAVVLGTVPLEGSSGLLTALRKGEPASHYLGVFLQNPWIEWTASIFAFFALVTSFFGMSLGLYDFLADALNIPKRGVGSVINCLLILLPTLFFAIAFERIFLLALDFSGAFGDSILNGIMPVLMVWVGRYIMHKKELEFRFSGGKIALFALILFFVLIVVLAIFMYAGYITSINTIPPLTP